MTDEDLRALERDLTATGAPAARIAYAHALERVGRRDDALAALVPASDDLAVRREIARWPAWRLAHGRSERAGAAPCAPRRGRTEGAVLAEVPCLAGQASIFPLDSGDPVLFVTRDRSQALTRSEQDASGSYLELEEVAELSVTGKVRWRVPLESHLTSFVCAIVPLRRRLLVLDARGTVLRLRRGP